MHKTDLTRLNTLLLLSAREAAINDADVAQITFGLNQQQIDWLQAASLEQLLDLAALPVLTYQPRFGPAFWEQLAVPPCRQPGQWSERAVLLAVAETVESPS